jgi:hypothetical protein
MVTVWGNQSIMQTPSPYKKQRETHNDALMLSLSTSQTSYNLMYTTESL